MARIQAIKARQILDSRGNPTVEADVLTSGGLWGRAAVPSGASTGAREALELRDGDAKNYLGKSVQRALRHIHEELAPRLQGHEVKDQRGLDELMIHLDGSPDKSRLGANALLAVSLAAARAGALESGLPLFRYLREELGCPAVSEEYRLPNPLMNIINGGQHASNNLDIQEFMIIPHLAAPFARNLQAGVEVFHHLKKVLGEQGHSTNVGDEGGFAPDLKSHEEALELILSAIRRAGYQPGVEVSLALDVAASEFFKGDHYQMQGRSWSAQEMIAFYQKLVEQYPIYSIEDGLDEGDHGGWQQLMKALGESTLLVGDDLFVTNRQILQEGIDGQWANAILVKLNQIGTLTETFETLELAFRRGVQAIISHRSGETGDSFIADLAVASSCGHIKTGSASRSDRLEKYNQLLRIEESLGPQAHYRPIK